MTENSDGIHEWTTEARVEEAHYTHALSRFVFIRLRHDGTKPAETYPVQAHVDVDSEGNIIGLTLPTMPAGKP